MSRCRSCDAEIVWARTSKGKPIPLDRDDDGGNIYVEEGFTHIFENHAAALEEMSVVQASDPPQSIAAFHEERGEKVPLYTAHFATCPNAAAHRRRT